jgi:hypothetical protein
MNARATGHHMLVSTSVQTWLVMGALLLAWWGHAETATKYNYTTDIRESCEEPDDF